GLRDQLQATIGVHVLIASEAVCIDQVEAHDRGPFRRPLHAAPALDSAAGRILAAHADDDEWERIAADHPDLEARREEWRSAHHRPTPPPAPPAARRPRRRPPPRPPAPPPRRGARPGAPRHPPRARPAPPPPPPPRPPARACPPAPPHA